VWLTLLALAATSPAFGLNSDGTEPVGTHATPAALTVSTSLDSCGIAGTDVVCKLDVSFSTVNGAASYNATVTRTDGSVVDYGAIGAGGASLWVPYVGPGSYSVRITAYGTPPHEGGRGNVVASGSDHPVKADVSGARGNNARTHRKPGTRINGAAATQVTQTGHPGNSAGTASTPPAAATTTEAPAPQQATTTTTPCEETTTSEPPLNPLPPDNDPDTDDEDADGVSDAEELAAAAAGQQLTLPGEATPPVSVDCS
jgi:hypothetical protein